MAPQDDLTAERAAAERVIRECPEVWNRVCYLSDCTFQALATRILEYGRQTRQEALREYREAIAHKLQLDHCHRTNMVSNKQIIAALDQIDIALDRLASEGG